MDLTRGAAVISLALAAVTAFASQSRTPPVVGGRNLYVSPAGEWSNDGSQDHPMDLARALTNYGESIRPGDTIWLRGGIYPGSFTSILTGTEEAPITVRSYPGERAVLDGASGSTNVLTVMGAWTTFRGVEVTNSKPDRVGTATSGPPIGVFASGPHTSFVNMVVHDTGQGFLFTPSAVDSVIVGNIIYNNGWDAPDRGHGHGIYAQNETGTKLIQDNIIFNQFSHGIHAWGTSQQHVDNIHIIGNVSFNNGAPAPHGTARNILLGGDGTSYNGVVESNYTYYDSMLSQMENSFGFGGGCVNGVATDNYFAGAVPLVVNCSGTTIVRNTLVGNSPAAVVSTYPLNTFLTVRPQGTKVFLRPNPAERRRVTVIVYNWDLRDRVRVDLSSAGYAAGDPYDLVDVQNYFGPVLLSGRYPKSGLDIPMKGLVPGRAAGNAPNQPYHTAPEFGVFIVRPATAVNR